jgi:hypothetical protein
MTLQEMIEKAMKERKQDNFAEIVAKARVRNESRAAVWAVMRHEMLKMVGPALVEDQPLPPARTPAVYGKPFCICELMATLAGVEEMWHSIGATHESMFADPKIAVHYLAPLSMHLMKSLQEKGILETGCGVWPDEDARYWWGDFEKHRPTTPIPITQFVTSIMATGKAALTQFAVEQFVAQFTGEGGQKPKKCGG